MEKYFNRPAIREVSVKDEFFTPYLDMIKNITLPYVFKKFEENDAIGNFRRHLEHLKNGTEQTHIGPPFFTGLVLESLRGACDFLAAEYDKALEALIEDIVSLVCEVSDAEPDGFICSYTELRGPDNERFGMAGSDIVHSHDLYNLGCLIEAAVSHYYATSRTTLLVCALRAASYICREIGDAPKKNVIPGHSLPEEAMIKLYRLIRDDRGIYALAAEYGVTCDEIMRVVRYWYDKRGYHEGRRPHPKLSRSYSQDHVTFKEQFTAEGHAVRAGLCYTGAAALVHETGDADYKKALDALWENVTKKKMHISGGIGTRHDIEGFDTDYNLPNNAYLETCASIALIFWAGEMSLLQSKAEYYDVIERALYNNVLASIGEDGMHYFYKNPLVSDGTVSRWSWHKCPCCPPMLLKLYSSLATYIYTYNDDTLCVNMFIGSRIENARFTAEQKDGMMKIDSKGRKLNIRIRIPEYAEGFKLTLNGTVIEPEASDGYAELSRIWSGDDTLEYTYDAPIRCVCANPKVEADLGKVAVMHGAYLMCAEGFDNNGNVDITVAEKPELTLDGDEVVGLTKDGGSFRLIPYYRWCRRESDNTDMRRMTVWLDKENPPAPEKLAGLMGEKLYMYC